MHEQPKLAVVISCYNYRAYVGHAIRSVLDQKRTDCELVVVDDGSTDGSWEEINRLGVTAYRMDNAGQRVACLFGLDRTRAPFVLFLDADDELMPGALAAIIDRLDPDVAKLQFALVRVNAGGDVISGPTPELEPGRDRHELVRQVLRTAVYKTPPTSGNVFRRDVCELLREAAYDRAVDGVILFAAPFMGDVVSLPDVLGRYRVHDRNDSGLGRLPDPASLERDIRRFVDRTEHLRAVIRRRDQGGDLIDSRDTFYFREHSLCLDVASGRRPALSSVPPLLRSLARERHSVWTKAALGVFLMLAAALPSRAAKALVARRFGAGRGTLFRRAKTGQRPGRRILVGS